MVTFKQLWLFYVIGYWHKTKRFTFNCFKYNVYWWYTSKSYISSVSHPPHFLLVLLFLHPSSDPPPSSFLLFLSPLTSLRPLADRGHPAIHFPRLSFLSCPALTPCRPSLPYTHRLYPSPLPSPFLPSFLHLGKFFSIRTIFFLLFNNLLLSLYIIFILVMNCLFSVVPSLITLMTLLLI